MKFCIICDAKSTLIFPLSISRNKTDQKSSRGHFISYDETPSQEDSHKTPNSQSILAKKLRVIEFQNPKSLIDLIFTIQQEMFWKEYGQMKVLHIWAIASHSKEEVIPGFLLKNLIHSDLPLCELEGVFGLEIIRAIGYMHMLIY